MKIKYISLLSLLFFVSYITNIEAFWPKKELTVDNIIAASCNCGEYDEKAIKKLIQDIENKSDKSKQDKIKRGEDPSSSGLSLMNVALRVAVDKSGMNHIKYKIQAYEDIIKVYQLRSQYYYVPYFDHDNFDKVVSIVGGEDKVKNIESYKKAQNCKNFSQQIE